MPDTTSLDRFTVPNGYGASKVSAWDELALGHIEDAERCARRMIQHLNAAKELNRSIEDTLCDQVSTLADVLSNLSAVKGEME